MANPDVSALASSFVEFGGQIFGKKVTNWNLRAKGIQVRTNVRAPQALTKLSSVGGPRPYSAADNISGNGSKFTDRILTAYQSKWDQDFDPEEFRNTYLANAREGQAPFYQEAMDQLAKEFLAAINNNTLWLGVRNGSGTTAADIADGWGTQIAAAITGSLLTPVATGALTASNAVAKFELMTANMPIWMREYESPAIIYCSFQAMDKYTQNYRTVNGFKLQPSITNDYPMDNVNAVIRPVSFMGTSSRLALTVENNFVFGTDAERVTMSASVRRNIIETRPMMPVGCQIQDLDALIVNDQA